MKTSSKYAALLVLASGLSGLGLTLVAGGEYLPGIAIILLSFAAFIIDWKLDL